VATATHPAAAAGLCALLPRLHRRLEPRSLSRMGDSHFVVNEAFRIGPNDVLISQHELGHWLVSKYPVSRDDPGWPGHTYSSTVGECPAGPDLDAMLAWVRAQPWSQPAAKE